MSNPIAHHSVAQHVLQRFCDSRGTLWTYDKQAGKIYPGTPLSQARKRYFYSFKDRNGVRNPAVERFLSQIDGDGKTAIQSLLQQERLTDERALHFMRFAAAQLLRVETYFQRLEQHLSPILQETANRMFKHDPEFKEHVTKELREMGASETDIEGLFASLERGEFQVTANRDYLKATFLQILDKLVSLFCQMNWLFLRIEDGTDTFLVSDNPLVLEDVGPRKSQPLGIANPNIEITMPLSPKVVAIGAWTGPTDYGVISHESIRIVNRRTIDQADRFVYAPYRSEELLTQVVESQGRQARTTIERIKLGKGSMLVAAYTN